MASRYDPECIQVANELLLELNKVLTDYEATLIQSSTNGDLYARFLGDDIPDYRVVIDNGRFGLEVY